MRMIPEAAVTVISVSTIVVVSLALASCTVTLGFVLDGRRAIGHQRCLTAEHVVEQLGLWAFDQVGLPDLLARLGANGALRTAAAGVIVRRVAHPASERETHRWLRVVVVVFAYRPADEAARLPLPERIRARAIPEAQEGRCEIRVVVPFGGGVPSSAKAARR